MQSQDKPIVGYYIRTAFPESLYKSFQGILDAEFKSVTLVQGLGAKRYGPDVDLILVQYNLGDHGRRLNPVQPGIRYSSYRPKERAASVWVGIDEEQFSPLSHEERWRLIRDTTLEAVSVVVERLSKKKLNFDGQSLLRDLQVACERASRERLASKSLDA